MKILMIISEAPPVKSGVSRVGEKLSQGLKRFGHQVDVLSLADIPRWEFGEVRLSSMPFKMGSLKKNSASMISSTYMARCRPSAMCS